MTNGNPRQRAFFDQLADEWNETVHHHPEKLEHIVSLLGLKQGQSVMDVGCGTGVMVPYLLRHIGNSGIIYAVDFSERMIEVARREFPPTNYPNVEFSVCDVKHAPMRGEYHAVLCYSCFPHLLDQPAAVQHLAQGLCRGGRLMIAHCESRDAINKMHSEAGAEVRKDHLPPAAEIAGMMKDAGLRVILKIDNDQMFVIASEKR